MRQLALIVLAVLWVAPAQAETKDGPDGFGPIKFGMTKEEAWAAIGGNGEWVEEGKTLEYEMDIPKTLPFLGESLRVRHLFPENLDYLAGTVGVFYESVALIETMCYREILYFLTHIRGKYGVEPLFLDQPARIFSLEHNRYDEIYGFRMKNGSVVTVEAGITPNSSRGVLPSGTGGPLLWCSIGVIYEPPTSEELPF